MIAVIVIAALVSGGLTFAFYRRSGVTETAVATPSPSATIAAPPPPAPSAAPSVVPAPASATVATPGSVGPAPTAPRPTSAPHHQTPAAVPTNNVDNPWKVRRR